MLNEGLVRLWLAKKAGGSPDEFTADAKSFFLFLSKKGIMKEEDITEEVYHEWMASY